MEENCVLVVYDGTVVALGCAVVTVDVANMRPIIQKIRREQFCSIDIFFTTIST